MSCCGQSRIEGARGDGMIEMRRAQLSFGDGLIAEEVSDLREEWMPHADQVLADEQIVAAVYEALARRHPKSRSRGRLGAPAEVVLRLLVLKHIRNLSYAALERDVRANLVYRDFTRVGGGKMPDAKTMGRWGLAVGPQVKAGSRADCRNCSVSGGCERSPMERSARNAKAASFQAIARVRAKHAATSNSAEIAQIDACPLGFLKP